MPYLSHRFLPLTFALLATPAWAAPPGVPQIEAGMHTAAVMQMASDGQGRWAVSASQDGSARVWALESGALLAVLRPPLAAGEGHLLAAAMSADGGRIALAAAGASYVYDRTADGRAWRLAHITSAPAEATVTSLALSADGRWLARGLAGTKGVQILDASSGALLSHSARYGGSCFSVAFSPAGGPLQLVSTSLDGRVRVYALDAKGQLGAARVAVGLRGKWPHLARFSPDGRRIAVAFASGAIPQVLEVANWREPLRLAQGGLRPGVDSVDVLAWSADGQSLAGLGQLQEGGTHAERWSAQNGRRLPSGTWPQEGLPTSLQGLPDGGWLLATSRPMWARVTADGAPRQVLPAPDWPGAQARQSTPLRLAANAMELHWDGPGRFPDMRQAGVPGMRFNLPKGRFAETDPAVLSAENHLAAVRLHLYGITGVDILSAPWHQLLRGLFTGPLPRPLFNPNEGAEAPADRGEAELDAGEVIACSAQPSHREQGVVWGSNMWLRAYQRNNTLQWRQAAATPVRAVEQSRNGRWVVALYGDGVLRWHRRDNGREVLALFIHADGRRWVAWTPEGFYDASDKDGEALLGFVTRHASAEANWQPASRWRQTLYQPARVRQRLSEEDQAASKP